MNKVKRAFLISSLNQYAVFVLSFVSVITFARLLTPAEIGVFALCSSLTLILTQLRNLGAGAYIVRTENLSEANIRSGLGVTFLMSWSMGLALILSSYYIEKFFDAEGLQLVIIIVSVNFFLAPFMGINAALLSKEMEFSKLAVLSMVNQTVIFISSLTLVLMGFSFYGMAWGFLIGSTVQFLIMFKYKSKRMLFRPSFTGLAPILKLGINTSGAGFLKTFEINLPDLFIGRMFNISSVAIFSRALGFQQFFTNLLVVGVNPVILPLLSDIKNSGKEPTTAYVNATTLLLGIALPILLVASAAAHPAVLLMFGNQWTDSIPLVSILALWAIFNIVSQFTPNLLIVKDLDNWLLYLQLLSSGCYAFLLYLSIPYGLTGIAYAMAIGGFFNMLINLVFLRLKVKIDVLLLLRNNIPSIIVGVVCYLVTYSIGQIIDFETTSPVLSILITAGTLPFVWLISIVATQHPIYNIAVKPMFFKVFPRK